METEVSFYCRRVTQELTLWLVGTIGGETNPAANARPDGPHRRILSFLLGIMIVWLLLSMMTSQLVYLAQPMSSLPIISPMIPFCHWEVFKGAPAHTSAGRPVHWADYPKLVNLQTETFDQLLDESIGGRGLASEVKKAEMASGDLITLVKASDLKSKDQIVEKLSRFVGDARGAGRSLHSLGSKINGAVDS
jgi:hypothetical protein